MKYSIKLSDLKYLETITERAFRDIYLSKKYSYKTFISEFDELVDNHCFSAKTPFNSLVISQPTYIESVVFTTQWKN